MTDVLNMQVWHPKHAIAMECVHLTCIQTNLRCMTPSPIMAYLRLIPLSLSLRAYTLPTVADSCLSTLQT